MTGDAAKRRRSASEEDETTSNKRSVHPIATNADNGNGLAQDMDTALANGTCGPSDGQGGDTVVVPPGVGEENAGGGPLSLRQKRILATILLNMCVVIIVAVQSFPQLFGLGGMPGMSGTPGTGLGLSRMIGHHRNESDELQLMMQHLLLSVHHVEMMALAKLAMLSEEEEEGESSEEEEEGDEEEGEEEDS